MILVRLAAVSVAVVAALSCSEAPDVAPNATAAADNEAHTGAITGRVVVDGAVPPPARIRIDGDPQCEAAVGGSDIAAEDLVVGNSNALQNAFVYVKAGVRSARYVARDDADATRLVLDQQKCRYTPRVLGVQVGQPLTIHNSDALLHTVRADASTNARFNVGTPIRGFEVVRTFNTPEVMIPVKCDMHPWMRAYVGVVDHPYFAVTSETGQFAIVGLPPGNYVLEIWHERLGTQLREVTLAAGQTADTNFTFPLR